MEKNHFIVLVCYMILDRHLKRGVTACNAALIVLMTLSSSHVSRSLRERVQNNNSRNEYLRRLFEDMSEVKVVCLIRMNISTFNSLCRLLRTDGGLKENGYVTIEEQVAMFLKILAHHHKNCVVSADFIRSRETISRCFNNVLNACMKLHKQLLEQPKPVENNYKDDRWKWFKGCLGALDGTYLDVRVPETEKSRYRSRKGHLATNVLGVCAQNMNFIFVLPGWEGLAADSRVLRDAINRTNGLKVPIGNYYLVDACYANAPGFLAPYRGTRYHLSECRQGLTPSNKQELYNLRHASARNVIERCFGVLKQRWAILRSPTWYPLKKYNRIIIACCLLQNLIRREMSIDYAENEYDREQVENSNGEVSSEEGENITNIECSTEWTTWRDDLAQQMYNEWLASRQNE